MVSANVDTFDVETPSVIKKVGQLILVCYIYRARRCSTSAQTIIPHRSDDDIVVIQVHRQQGG